MATELNIVAVSKRVPWVESVVNEGPDYSAATFAMELRYQPGDTGAALVSLTNAASGSQGISCTYNAAFPDPDGGAAFPASTIRIQINEATMESLAVSSPTSAPVIAHYDLVVTPASGPKFVLIYGTFTYYPGTTL